MNAMRFHTANHYNGLKAVSRELVAHNDGPTGAARLTRLSQQDISRCISGNEEHESRFLPIDVVTDLEAACGLPIVSRKLAELNNFLLIPLPEGVGSTGMWSEALGDASSQVGDVLVVIGQSLKDRKITPEERCKARREIREAHQALARLDKMLEQYNSEAEQ